MRLKTWLEGLDRRTPSFPRDALLFLGMVSLLVVPAMGILLVQTVRAEMKDNRARAALQHDGAVVTGTVTKVRSPNRWNAFPSAARVAFSTEAGEQVTTWIPVSHTLERGARIEVRYSRQDPSVARVPGDETPNRGRWKLIAIGGPVFSIVLVAVICFLEGLRRRREGSSSNRTGNA